MSYACRILAALVLPVLVAGLFSAVPVASAAETTCDCWCETKAGATRYPANSTAKLTRIDCQAACTKEYPGYSMAVCAASSDQLPSQNVSCFTNDQCALQNGTFDSKYQPPECMAGSRYCYPDKSKAAKVTLSTSIAGLTVTGDFGEYIAKVYQWMVGSATLIAIVFIMVSGLRWTLGGLSAEQVKKAKTTISNSIVGLVLLLGTYLILFTVNPQLLKLQVPEFPMIRQIAVVTAGTSCGYLTGDSGRSGRRTQYDSDLDMSVYVYGDSTGYPGSPFNQSAPEPKGGKPYILAEPTDGELCGSVAKVVKDWEGNDVAEGTTCAWDTCPKDSGTLCLVSSSEAKCRTCGAVVLGNSFVEPSSSICAQLSLPEDSEKVTRNAISHVRGGLLPHQLEEQKDIEVPIINRCFWTRDGTMIAGITNPVDVLSSSGTCAMLSLDCTKILSCESYDSIPKVSNNHQTFGKLEHIRNHGTQTGILGFSGSFGDLSLTSICNEDPCQIGIDGKTRCRADQPLPRTDSWTAFVNFQGNDCKTVNTSD